MTLPRKRGGGGLSNANSSSWPQPVVGSLVSITRAQTHVRLWFQDLGELFETDMRLCHVTILETNTRVKLPCHQRPSAARLAQRVA